MKNPNAVLINTKLGSAIYDESILNKLELNKFTKKQIKKMMIDDLITSENRATARLIRLTHEILNDKNEA